MLVNSFPILALAAAGIASAAHHNRTTCGTAGAKGRELIELDIANFMKTDEFTNSFNAEEIVIPTVYHLCKTTRAEALAQHDELNRGFAQGNIRFWILKINENQCSFAGSTREGGYNVLNIWSNDMPGLLGLATLPYQGCSVGNDFCRIVPYQFPGRGGDYGTGKIALHEVGHWMGLYHTFDGGCSATGDYVDDTPAIAKASWKCHDIDSCPSLPGRDDPSNHMDYVADSCKRNFTPGQYERMRAQWNMYRKNCAPLPTGPTGTVTTATTSTTTGMSTATRTTSTGTASASTTKTTTKATTSVPSGKISNGVTCTSYGTWACSNKCQCAHTTGNALAWFCHSGASC